MNHKKAILLTVCVAVLWSLAGLNIKMISWPPYAIAGGRSVIASILLYPLLKRGGNIKIDKYVIGGALCYASFNYCFNISTKLASSAIAIMMQYTAPIYVAILAWIFLKEKITKADIISLVVVFEGMLIFFLDRCESCSGCLQRNHLCRKFHLSPLAEKWESSHVRISWKRDFRCCRNSIYGFRRCS